MTYQDFITKTNGNAHVPRADWNACYAPVADWAIGLKKSDLAALGFDFQHGGKSMLNPHGSPLMALHEVRVDERGRQPE